MRLLGKVVAKGGIEKMVAKGGIEPPTQGFSGALR
jgi:hypothetical protein